jgi:hypothetical protein
MDVNRNHKSSVFSTLFGDREVLRELYSAIEGIEIPKDIPIDINTLSNIFVKGKINDLSFTIDNRLVVLIEHQSSINNNMPLRLLLYITEIYKMKIRQDALFQRKQIKIPTPEFIVLYNGEAPFPDYQKMKLSDAFLSVEGLKLPKENGPSLELEVHVYNINYGRNPGLLEKCSALNGYSILVNKIREYSLNLSLEDSVRAAVKYCIENKVLKEFIDKYGSEVENMLFENVTVEDEIAAAREEAFEEGLETGVQKGRKEGLGIGEARGEEKNREYVLGLIEQGLTTEEIQRILRERG